MAIRGIEGLSLDDIEREVAAGGRFVFYEYCVSVLIASSRRPTDVFFLRANDRGILRGLPYCLLSLLLGWWGLPWGPIYTPLTLFNNLCGGCEVTEEVLGRLQGPKAAALTAELETRIPPCEEA
jgi:hypothetical protein